MNYGEPYELLCAAQERDAYRRVFEREWDRVMDALLAPKNGSSCPTGDSLEESTVTGG